MGDKLSDDDFNDLLQEVDVDSTGRIQCKGKWVLHKHNKLLLYIIIYHHHSTLRPRTLCTGVKLVIQNK